METELRMDTTLDQLFPALVEAFTIICAGYLAGRFRVMPLVQARGLGQYISKFALPALLFLNMCELNFKNVNWMFLLSILIAKTAVFFLVAILTLLFLRPVHWGKTGLYAIFATQSNDFALGYPIVQAVYKTTHPYFINYLYLVAPISLVFLNPIGFTLLELDKWKKTAPDRRTLPLRALCTIVKGVMLNPIVFMSVLGIAANFVFSQHVPNIFRGVLTVLGDSFAATALFCLGLTMVGKVQTLTGKALLVPLLLICAKMLLLPFVARAVSDRMLFLMPHKTNTTVEHDDLTSYAFLYGTIPTAPTVFIYATQYDIALPKVGTGMVIGTFLSAPVMFVSAKMITMTVKTHEQYISVIYGTTCNVSILTVICAVWVLAVLLVSQRFFTVPHCFTFGLLISQILMSLGVIMWYYMQPYDGYLSWPFFVYFPIFWIGLLSTRCWIAMLALGIALLRKRNLCFLLEYIGWLKLYCFGVPALATGLLLLICQLSYNQHTLPSYAYGMPQLVISTSVTCVNLIVSFCSLITLHRQDHTYMSCRSRTTSACVDNPEIDGACDEEVPRNVQVSSDENERGELETLQESPVVRQVSANSRRRVVRGSVKRPRTVFPVRENCDTCVTRCDAPSGMVNIEDIVAFPSTHSVGNTCTQGSRGRDEDEEQVCEQSVETNIINDDEATLLNNIDENRMSSIPTRCTSRNEAQCTDLINRCDAAQYGSMNEEEIAVAMTINSSQITRHLVLVIIMLASSLISLFFYLWKLMKEADIGVSIEIEFLECVLTYGQGVFVLGLFGFDQEMVIFPFLRRIRRLFHRPEVALLLWEELDPLTQQTCWQFSKHHKETCCKAIVGCRRFSWRRYRKVFTGTDLVDWLTEVGLTPDREEALTYGKQLLEGQVIEHVKRQQHFHDLPYIYRFNEDLDLTAPQRQ